MQLQFAEEQILDRIRFDNPWWINGQIEDFYNRMPHRLYFELFHPLVSEEEPRRAVVLMGPRRVGKTVMLYQTIQELIRQGISPKRLLYLSVETPIYSKLPLDYLFKLARQATGNDEDQKGWYVFFDEIQYLGQWEVHLKSLVDSYRGVKFIASGSATAALRFASLESGAGRFTDFMLPPLTFNEFLALKKLDHLMLPGRLEWEGAQRRFFHTSDISELNKQFIDYLNFGGYPEVIFSETIQNNPGRYIRSDIIDKVLLRDLPILYGIQDVQELNALFSMIAYNTAQEVSLEGLSKSSGGVQKPTLKRYIEYLEAAFLLKVVRRVGQDARRFQRDNYFKVYLTNPSLRSALFSPIAPTDDRMGALVETAIFAQWLHRDWYTPYYARWQSGEVDMVGLDTQLKPAWAVEIKWSNRFIEKPHDLKNLLAFCQKNELSSAVVTTIDKSGTLERQGITLHFVPASVYAYVVGRNTLDRKMLR